MLIENLISAELNIYFVSTFLNETLQFPFWHFYNYVRQFRKILWKMLYLKYENGFVLEVESELYGAGEHQCQGLFFNKVSEWRNFVKKETLAQLFSCAFCKNFKITFLHRTPPGASSVIIKITANKTRAISSLKSTQEIYIKKLYNTPIKIFLEIKILCDILNRDTVP